MSDFKFEDNHVKIKDAFEKATVGSPLENAI